MNKFKLLCILPIAASVFLSGCGDSESDTPKKTTNNSSYQRNIQQNSQENYQGGYQPSSSQAGQTNKKLQAQRYRMLADQASHKAQAQQSHVDFAKQNLDKNPTSATASMMYNSAVQLQQTYENQANQYSKMAIQAEAGE